MEKITRAVGIDFIQAAKESAACGYTQFTSGEDVIRMVLHRRDVDLDEHDRDDLIRSLDAEAIYSEYDAVRNFVQGN